MSGLANNNRRKEGFTLARSRARGVRRGRSCVCKSVSPVNIGKRGGSNGIDSAVAVPSVESDDRSSATNTPTAVPVPPITTASERRRSRSESSLFRQLYIGSDFQSTQGKALNSERVDKEKPKFCFHGVLRGLCREITCWEVLSAEIEGVEKRGVGTITGLKNFEYLISVKFTTTSTKRQIWHRYSGFKRLHDMLKEKFPFHHIFEDDGVLFPPKKKNKWSSKLAEERKEKLDIFLKAILSDQYLKNDSTIKEFLSLDDTTRMLFYEENQQAPTNDE